MRAGRPYGRAAGYILICGAIISILLAGGCSLEKPKAPTWDADLTVPLIAHHYDIYELIDRLDEDALSYDSAGNLSLSFSQGIDTVWIDAGLHSKATSQTNDYQLGAMRIITPQPLALELIIREYTPLSAGIIDEIGFDANKDFEQMAELEYAVYDSGILILTVTNNIGLVLDSLTVRIIDNVLSSIIAVRSYEGGLAIGASKIDTIDLAGMATSGQLGVMTRMHTPGGVLFSVADQNLAISLEFGQEVIVSSALAQVPVQEKNYTTAVELEEQHRISSAEISSGQITIALQNSSALAATLTITVPELTIGGQPYTLQTPLSAGEEYTHIENLDGYELHPDLTAELMSINLDLNAAFASSGEAMVLLQSTDEIDFRCELSDLNFAQVTGIIAPTTTAIPAVEYAVEIPKGMEQVSLTESVINLKVHSEMEIPTQITVELQGEAGQYLETSTTLEPGTIGNPGLTELILEDITSLTLPLPNRITVSGMAEAGTGLEEGTVYAGSRVWGEVEITSPLKFALGPTEIEADVNSTEIEQDEIEEISERLLSGIVYATITNHLPFGCELELYLSGDSATLYEDPELSLGPLTISAGNLNHAGLVISPSINEATIHLSEEDLDIVENPVLYIGQKIILPGTSGQEVNIINTDYLKIEAYLKLTGLLGGEWD